jgi:transposase InsO family protein
MVSELFNITRQAYYQRLWREEIQEREEAIILECVRQIRRKHPNMGTRKILYKIDPMLEHEEIKIGRDKLFFLLKGEDLLVKPKKAYRKTTMPGHWRVPNLLPGLEITYAKQVIVCDITYVEVEIGRFVYLFLIMDLFSRYILGWHVADTLGADGAIHCLEIALPELINTQQQIIHHSDHGVQYVSLVYLETLNSYQILPSMGAVGNCYDNIFAERVIGTLKHEYTLNSRFKDKQQVISIADEAVYLYNRDRPHLSLNMAVPYDIYCGNFTIDAFLKIPLKENNMLDFNPKTY